MSHLLATHAQYGGYGTGMYPPTVSVDARDNFYCALIASICSGLPDGIRSEQFLSDELRSSRNAYPHARWRLRSTDGYVYATARLFDVLAPSKFN